MSMKLLRILLITVFVLPGLISCGGGGSSSASAGGTGGTGVSFGTVTGFGSVIVNDSHLDDSTAQVTLDDNPGAGPHGGLKQGMVVKVSGTFSGNTGTATSIEFRDNLEGRVCASSTADGITTLRVLGQRVIQDATTIVENGPITVNSSIVEVSGLPELVASPPPEEQIRASFIEVKSAPTEVEVKGRIDTVDDLAKVLTIDALEVDYSTALVDNNIGGTPAVGQFVEVKGAATDATCNISPGIDHLVASKVELEPEGAGQIPNGVRAEVEGFITEINAQGFKVGEKQVVLAGNVRFLPDNFGIGDLAVGAKVEAEGTFANGVLTATKISFRENVRLESDVATGNNDAFTLKGLAGINITTNSNTDSGGVTIGPDVAVRVRGIEGPNNTVLATRIQAGSGGGSSNAFLQGAVDTNVNGVVTVLGILVTTGGIFQFENIDDAPIQRQQFLDAAQPGVLVKFKGDLQGSTIVYDEAELED